MLDTGADSRALGVFSSAFDRSFDSRWATTPPAGDGARVGGGALVDGELLDEATLNARENELATLSAHLDAATHRQLTLIRLMDVTERWAQQGAKSCAAWLSWRIGLAPGPAREHVRVAKALAALPQIDDALRRGAISYSKVRAMTRVATPANEQKLLDAALETTAAQLEKLCRGMRQVQREDGRPQDDSPERAVRLRYRGDGTVRVEAVLLPDEAQRVMDALRLVRAAMSEEQAPPPATRHPRSPRPSPTSPTPSPASPTTSSLAGDKPTHVPAGTSRVTEETHPASPTSTQRRSSPTRARPTTQPMHVPAGTSRVTEETHPASPTSTQRRNSPTRARTTAPCVPPSTGRLALRPRARTGRKSSCTSPRTASAVGTRRSWMTAHASRRRPFGGSLATVRWSDFVRTIEVIRSTWAARPARSRRRSAAR